MWTGSDQHQRFIRASEVGEYVYCAQAWWLGRVQNLPSEHRAAMETGRMAHRRHGRDVRVPLALRRLGCALLACALILVILAAVR